MAKELFVISSKNENNNVNFISINAAGEIVETTNVMDLDFMSKEQAFKVAQALRLTNPERKIRVKVVSQALRDMITDVIVNRLPNMTTMADEIVETFVAAMKPKKAEPAETETTEEEAWEGMEK